MRSAHFFSVEFLSAEAMFCENLKFLQLTLTYLNLNKLYWVDLKCYVLKLKAAK